MTKTLADRSRKNTVEARVAEQKQAAGFVDLTPSWSGILPLYLMAIENGNPSARDAAFIELTRMAKLADLYNEKAKAKPDTVGPDHANTRLSIAHNAERESVRADQHVRHEMLSIKSDVTPETVYFKHYPDTADRDGQFHVNVIQANGISGAGSFLRKADALLVRDFLNEFYPVA